MAPAEFRVFDGYDEMSRAAASRFVDAARERIESSGVFSAALSGGETPKGFLEALAQSEFADRVDWARAELFQVDERPVPPDHTDSNYRMIRESFLTRVPNAVANFHRMHAERSNLDEAARAYEAELVQALADRDEGVPRLDLILLGMGSDGHTASLFPHSPGLAERARWVIPNYVEKFALTRLTLTYPSLNAGREVIFLVSGGGKAEIVQKVIEGPRDPARLPSQGIDPAGGKIFWYLDKTAAARLHRSTRTGD